MLFHVHRNVWLKIANVVAEMMMKGVVEQLHVADDDEKEPLFYSHVDVVAYWEDEEYMVDAVAADQHLDKMFDELVQVDEANDDVVAWHDDEMMNQLHSFDVNDVD